MKAELNSSSGPRLILVTPGSFIMGSPQNEPGHMYWEGQREITLSHAFYLGATPVTQRQYERVTGENPTDHPGTAEDAPVDSVGWQASSTARTVPIVVGMNSFADSSNSGCPKEVHLRNYRHDSVFDG